MKIYKSFVMVNILKKFWPYYITSTSIVLYLIKRYFVGGVCKCTTNLTGKVVIVTGATKGIGKEVASVLAERGAHIIIASRDIIRGPEVCFEILKLTGNPNISFYYLDFTSFKSVQDFSRIIHNRKPIL
ncbi:retinol dehydrogenase 12-like [Daktulosphaira vitifoliae]|uniref:retinol dehydrogenase 12-like n=1 Tax=Daktulosphaira vitifoliae TaxID=58002 RepID=UPI0021AA5DD1|nr:retinol dehydrogenase 12-like [Daktulosphaira vitifoliae]